MVRFMAISPCVSLLVCKLCRHMQQPIYWPAVLPSNPSTYQKAYDSIQLKQSQGGHPQDNLDDIFGKGVSLSILSVLFYARS